MKRIAVPLLLITFLAACQSQPPQPTDKYYRLRLPVTAAMARPALDGTLVVRPLRADGPLAERPMIFTRADKPLQVEQYYYQHWEAPPPLLVQEYLRQDLATRHAASHVTDTANGDYVLEGRILRFEKMIGPQGSHAVVECRLVLSRRHPMADLMDRVYHAEAPLADDTPHALAEGMEAALQRVAADFARDLSMLRGK